MSKLTLDGFFSYCKQIAEHIQLGERMASLSGQSTPKLTSGVGNLYYDSILPYREDAGPQTREFLARVVDVLLDFIQKVNDRDEKILEFKMPEEMQKVLDLHLPDEPLPLKQLLEDCKVTLKHQVKTGHPHFFNQLSCGLDIISLAGEWLTAAANTNMFTYEIAPVFILMENVVLEKMRAMIGWKTGDSILAPGKYSLVALCPIYMLFLAARHHKFPQYKEKGLTSIPGHLVMFTSDQCHYSVKSCASVCGLGTDYCVCVPSDERGRMIPTELERLVRYHKDRGHVPFFVNATSGTTVLGAFDPLMEIADICEKYDMWMHVDV
ncbi:glutamate decarboxylase like protein, partial [Danaus plexippus plexippus]